MNESDNYVFVTVGTTKFDELIKKVDNVEFHEVLKEKGYNGLLIQFGNSVVPINTKKDKKFPIVCYNFKDSINQDVCNCSLMISHAGAGSIMDGLEQNKPIISVTNDSLADNHQSELSEKLQELDFTLTTNCSNLNDTVNSKLDKFLNDRFDYRKYCNDLPLFSSFLQNQESNFTFINGKCKTMVVLGSGGHTREMIHILDKVDKTKFNPRCYVLANNDKRSSAKFDSFEKGSKDAFKKTVPRSRNVGQSYFSSVFTTIYAFFFCFYLIIKEKPNLLICNGPGTCLPLCISAYICSFFHVINCKIVYVESIARVSSCSLVLKILIKLNLCHYYIVPWKELKKICNRDNVYLENYFFHL